MARSPAIACEYDDRGRVVRVGDTSFGYDGERAVGSGREPRTGPRNQVGPEKASWGGASSTSRPLRQDPEFYGRFEELVAGGSSTVFDHKMAPRQVRVHMRKALLDDTYWVLVRWL